MAMHKWKARVYMEGSSKVVEVETEAQDIFKVKKILKLCKNLKNGLTNLNFLDNSIIVVY